MKKTWKSILALSLSALMIVPIFAGCGEPFDPTDFTDPDKFNPDDFEGFKPGQIGGMDTDEDNMAQIPYPAFPETPADKNSWEYIPEDNDMEITWYVDVSSWPIPADNNVLKKIKQDTGISIKFMTPVDDSGQKLTTMIAGDEIPDIVSVPTSNFKIISSFAQQGYAYDINTLADKWAPTLYSHLPEDVLKWWEFGNGKTYGVPNHYYSYEDIPKDEQLQPNGGMMVRKDIFDAWQARVENFYYTEAQAQANGYAFRRDSSDGLVHYTGSNGQEKTVEWQGYITTPEGFKEAAKWAMENYYGTSKGKITTGLQLSQFAAGGNASLTWLAQFFAVPFEDRDGNYIYQFTSDEYAEVLYYLNDLYNTKAEVRQGQYSPLISSGNFSQNYDGVGGVIAGGKAFATLATPQDYQMHFAKAKDDGYTYVSMYITNEDGDAPVLADIRGYGYLFNMITTSCSRPNLVIKLFDYLSSEQGQNLICFGVQGDTWNYGEDGKTIEYTEKYLTTKADTNKSTASFGMMSFDLLINYQYYDNVQPRTNNGKTEDEIFRTDLKRPLSIYAYDYNATHFVVDATDKRFMEYYDALNRIDALIGQQIPKILKASNRANAVSEYNKTVSALQARKLELVVQMNSEAYQKTKQKLGVTVAWPAYQKDYVSPLDRTQPNGDLSLYRGTY